MEAEPRQARPLRVAEVKPVLALSGQLASVTGTLPQTLRGVEVAESERLPPSARRGVRVRRPSAPWRTPDRCPGASCKAHARGGSGVTGAQSEGSGSVGFCLV